MITLITGAPGSGKTLYVVAKLLGKIAGTSVDGIDDDGNKVTYPRTIYSNINRLLIEHELVDEAWLSTWFDNIKPGAFIVYDEVQKPWPNRPVGSKVPEYIQRLETHRHQGCDFVLMTQNPQLVDPNLRKLVGRHLHIRRVGNQPFAIVYEWDSCSNSLNLKNSFTKSPWRFDSKAQGQYKSAEVHTKVPRRMPTAIFVFALALAGAAYMWPSLITRISKPLQAHASTPAIPPGGVPPGAAKASSLFAPGGDLVLDHDQAKKAPGAAEGAPGGLGIVDALKSAPGAIASLGDTFAGCAKARDVCVCYTSAGTKADKPAEFCEEATRPGLVQLELDDQANQVTGRPGAAGSDRELLQWVYRDRQPYRIQVHY